MPSTRSTRSSSTKKMTTKIKSSSKNKKLTTTKSKKVVNKAPPSPTPSIDHDDSDSDSDDEAVISAINLAASAVKAKLAKFGSISSSTSTSAPSNELTFLIPGYTAPMSLTVSSGAPELYIDYSSKGKKGDDFSKNAASLKNNPQFAASSPLAPPTGHIMKAAIKRKKVEKTDAGSGWFNIPSYTGSFATSSYKQQRNADLIKDDLKVIKMRNYLDPKKFYKTSDEFSPFAQRGTIVESGAEFFSSRLTKAERRQTLLDEVMSDSKTRKYVKRKFGDVQVKSESGGVKSWKQRQNKKISKNTPLNGNLFSGSRKKFS